MEPEGLVGVMLSTLGFNAFLVALLLGAHGFAVGRLWPEGGGLPPWRSLLQLAPGFLLAGLCTYLVAKDYLSLTKAISRKEMLDFAAAWINSFWYFYGFLIVAILATALGAARARNI